MALNTIAIQGNTLTATTGAGRVAVWDNVTSKKVEPSRMYSTKRDLWTKSGVENVLLGSQKIFLVGRLSRTASAVTFEGKPSEATKWKDPWVTDSTHTNKYRWVSQDCTLTAIGYQVKPSQARWVGADDDADGTYVPQIDIFNTGQPNPLISIKPIKKSVVDFGFFITSIVEKGRITMVGSDGLIQIRFGGGCEDALQYSTEIHTYQAIDGFKEPSEPLNQSYERLTKHIPRSR